MFEELIENFEDENGYISNFYELTEYLNEQNIDIKETNRLLMKIIAHNNLINKTIKKENKKEKEALAKIEKNKKENKIEIVSKELKKEETIFLNDEEDDKEINISYYIDYIDEILNSSFDEEKISCNLPTLHNPDFLTIMNLLIIHYSFEKNKLYSLLNTDDQSMDDYINEEIIKFDNLLNILTIKKNDINILDNITEEKKKTILFNPDVIMSDLDLFEMNEYNDLYLMFTSMEDNILKNVKKYTPIGHNKSVNQIRINTTRALFEKLDDNTFYVYYVFHKEDTDKFYHNKLINRIKDYSKEKDYLTKPFYSIDDKEKFLDEESKLYREVFNKIKPKVKTIEV